MRRTVISKFHQEVNTYYTNENISLPKDYSDQVEKHWEELQEIGKDFFRGDVYTISKIEETNEKLDIFVSKTDYAHFLYTIHRDKFVEPDCRVIHTSVLIETVDGRFAIGEMNLGTAAPGKLQFIGGGIDKNDIKDNVFDLRHNIEKEINEEVGIDVEDKTLVKELKPYVLKSGGKDNFLSAIFKMDLLIDEGELKKILNRHNEKLISKGENPEIKSLVFLDKSKDDIEEFVKNSKRKKDKNLDATLMATVGIIPVEDSILH
jgi:8-oxo-dGTP pyrophosphatase MutT (NUDIX family)